MPFAEIQAPHGPVFEFFVLFCVILLGPIVFTRFKLPGLIGLVIGGFLIGPHGLAWIGSGNLTVPELGHLGLLYLMFVAGLELDLRVLRAYRQAAVLLGLLAFCIPMAFGFVLGQVVLGWSLPATFLLGALFSSHTLIVYPRLRDAGLGGNPAVASAVGATVLTDTLALVVLAIVAGTQTGAGSPAIVLLEILIGLAVLIGVGLTVLPRAVDEAFRRWGSDPVARFVVILVALLFMAVLAEVFDIEGIVGAFFAGLAINRLVPNEGPSMHNLDFFGAAVFVPVFLVSIGLLLDPAVMLTQETLGLAALICAGALGGKAIACWLAGVILRFDWPERAGMYVLTAPQAAATLAATLVGFEIGLFGTSLVNAVLVLILVSIVLSAILAERVVQWMPQQVRERLPLGAYVVVLSGPAGPSDAAVRVSTLLTRPDGGHGDVLIADADGALRPDAAAEKATQRRIYRQGFDGHIRRVSESPARVLARSLERDHPSLVIIDGAGFEPTPADVPLLVVDGAAVRLVEAGPASEVADEIQRRLAAGTSALRVRRRDRTDDGGPRLVVAGSATTSD